MKLTSDVGDIVTNITVPFYNWTVGFRKVMQQRIWGEVVDFMQFISEYNSERIIRIGPYLPKLLWHLFAGKSVCAVGAVQVVRGRGPCSDWLGVYSILKCDELTSRWILI